MGGSGALAEKDVPSPNGVSAPLTIHHTVLPCGLVVLTEERPESLSVSLSLTLKEGSRHEDHGEQGLYHLLEHLVFKGTRSYTQEEIARWSDRLGGDLNAYTSKETTQFHIETVREQLDRALDILMELAFHARWSDEDFEREVEVIRAEIREGDDHPETHSFERFYEQLFPGQGLGHPIAGTEEDLLVLQAQTVRRRYREIYRPENMVLVAVGGIRHEALLQVLQRFSPDFDKTEPLPFRVVEARAQRVVSYLSRPSWQQHQVILGFPGQSLSHPDRFAHMLLNDILGAGMSSRLFQNVRERQGLAYTIGSFHDAYADLGVWGVYAVVEPRNLEALLETLRREIDQIRRVVVTQEELESSRDHLCTSLVLSMENNGTRMRYHANRLIYGIGPENWVDVLDAFAGVSGDDLLRLSRDSLMKDEMASLMVLGPDETGDGEDPSEALDG